MLVIKNSCRCWIAELYLIQTIHFSIGDFKFFFLNICINWALSDLGHNEQKIIIINIHPSISLVKISISVHPCDLPV